MSIEAMKQALEALELGCTDHDGNPVDLVGPAITALRAAIAEASGQDVQQEMEPYDPLENNADYERGFVAGMQHQMRSNVDRAVNEMARRKEWVGLTDEEQFQIVLACGCASEDWLLLARAIEAKLKEKNT